MCPCGNDAPNGTVGGCLNSTGASCRLIPSGNSSLTTGSLRFDLTGGVSNAFAVLISADNALPNMGPCPVGSGLASAFTDGLRCTGGSLLRHGSRALLGDGSNANPWGPPTGNPQGIGFQFGFESGQTRRFQAFYREDPMLSCGTGQNTSDGVEVTFVN